jgi:dolichyl-phosphate beta-glucosyltransferase
MPQPDHEPINPRSISIVIPAFNESARIVYTLNNILQYAARGARVLEIIVVDDGSTDGTGAIVAGLNTRRPVLEGIANTETAIRVLRNDRNRGKGHSVREGMMAAVGNVVLMCDADMSAPIRQVERLLAALDEGYEVAIGSRDMPDAVLDPPQPWRRRVLAGIFGTIRRRMLLADIRDTQCGFKLFSREAAHRVFAAVREDGWLFDCEALEIARRFGYRVKEVGITWRNHIESHVHPLRETVRTIPALFRIRRRLRSFDAD